jgi:hypothetical protein
MPPTFQPVRKIAPHAPAYREAYPRLNIAAALRALKEGRNVCAYERRRPLGHIICTLTPIGLIVDFEIIPDGNGLVAARGDQGFKLIREDRTGVRDKRFLLCPVCKRPRQSVFFGRAWACAECHKLLRRSQVIPHGVGLREQRDDLRTRVGRGRPRGMHSSTYIELVNRLEQLDLLATKYPLRLPSEEHCQMISEEWLPLETFHGLEAEPTSRWYRTGI